MPSPPGLRLRFRLPKNQRVGRFGPCKGAPHGRPATSLPLGTAYGPATPFLGPCGATRRLRLGRTGRAALVAAVCATALATSAAPTGADNEALIEEIVVVATAPDDRTGMPAAKLPYASQAADADQVDRSLSLDLSDFLERTFTSVSLNDAQNNPLQPDLQYRGYTASPLLGLAQGIAVHVNGARFNEPLGDTVNWDLMPVTAIHSVQLMGGANPAFGLNTLGGALSLRMKDGFRSPGMGLEAWGGSHGRRVVAADVGGNRAVGSGALAYHIGAHGFDEDGWRDLSASSAGNAFGSVGWRGARSEMHLRAHRATSDLLGNGAVPVELLALDRKAIFTAPDRTENTMTMLSLDASRELSDGIQVAANLFHRSGGADAFNGDASEFAECELGGGDRLIEGLEEDDLEEIGLDDDDVCQGQFMDAEALEDFLNEAADDDEFDVEDLTDDLSGTGELADDAVNNISRRRQTSRGGDVHATFAGELFGAPTRALAGVAWYRGDTNFHSVTELAELNPDTRSTEGLGTGTFVDDLATRIDTRTETRSLYLTASVDASEAFTVTASARMNDTRVTLQDQSGERPELDGEHDYFRVNPHLGAVWNVTDSASLYAGIGMSSRAPTPIELACNEHVFERAAEFGDDEEFECRLPNAFLADPPLDDVVTRGFEAGARGLVNGINYHLGLFHSINTDDILFQTTGRATGLFANVDETRRAGVELALNGSLGRLDWRAAYTRLEATFGQDFHVLSPNHRFADDDGEVLVRSGSRIPGLPDQSFKLGVDYAVGSGFEIGFDLVAHGGQYLRGDESNGLPRLPGYQVLDLRMTWQATPSAKLFLRIENAFDEEYESFGLIGESPAEVEVPLFRDFENPRFVSPGAPRGIFAGVRLRLQPVGL